MDFSLYRTIARQGGVFTTAQARERYTEWEIRRLVQTGRWRRTRWRGVLVDGELPESPAVVVRAASLVVGSDLVACHSTAAALHGFDVLPAQTLHFLGPAAVANRRRPGIQVHPSTLGTDDAVLVGGVWCTPAARTACDVVRLTPPIDGLATLDAALRSGSCTRAESSTAARAQAGLREVTRLRALVPLADGRAQSPMESRMRWRFVDGGLPVPEVQVRVGDDGSWREMDTGWRRERVGAEFDGLAAHMTTEQLGLIGTGTTGSPSTGGPCCTSPPSTCTGERTRWSPPRREHCACPRTGDHGAPVRPRRREPARRPASSMIAG